VPLASSSIASIRLLAAGPFRSTQASGSLFTWPIKFIGASFRSQIISRHATPLLILLRISTHFSNLNVRIHSERCYIEGVVRLVKKLQSQKEAEEPQLFLSFFFLFLANIL
jgi:hypothetical protein